VLQRPCEMFGPTRIRASVPDLTVLVLHHMNARGNRGRGSTVTPGALNTQLYLKAAKDTSPVLQAGLGGAARRQGPQTLYADSHGLPYHVPRWAYDPADRKRWATPEVFALYRSHAGEPFIFKGFTKDAHQMII
jgi:hypothetical protein